MVETHFKDKVSVVFQVVLGEFQIRAKGGVNDAKKGKNAYQNKYFELQNLTKWFCNELNFLVTAHVRATSIQWVGGCVLLALPGFCSLCDFFFFLPKCYRHFKSRNYSAIRHRVLNHVRF